MNHLVAFLASLIIFWGKPFHLVPPGHFNRPADKPGVSPFIVPKIKPMPSGFPFPSALPPVIIPPKPTDKPEPTMLPDPIFPPPIVLPPEPVYPLPDPVILPPNPKTNPSPTPAPEPSHPGKPPAVNPDPIIPGPVDCCPADLLQKGIYCTDRVCLQTQ